MAEAASGGRTWWAHFELTRINIEPIILRKKIEEQLVLGANGFGPRSFCLWKYQEGQTRTLRRGMRPAGRDRRQ